MNTDKTINTAKRVLKIEAEAITGIAKQLDANFAKAVTLILNAAGKVVITGMGKSGLICKKIAEIIFLFLKPRNMCISLRKMHEITGTTALARVVCY